MRGINNGLHVGGVPEFHPSAAAGQKTGISNPVSGDQKLTADEPLQPDQIKLGGAKVASNLDKNNPDMALQNSATTFGASPDVPTDAKTVGMVGNALMSVLSRSPG